MNLLHKGMRMATTLLAVCTLSSAMFGAEPVYRGKTLNIIPVSLNPQDGQYHALIAQWPAPNGSFDTFSTKLEPNSFAQPVELYRYFITKTLNDYTGNSNIFQIGRIAPCILDGNGQRADDSTNLGYLFVEVPYDPGISIHALPSKALRKDVLANPNMHARLPLFNWRSFANIAKLPNPADGQIHGPLVNFFRTINSTTLAYNPFQCPEAPAAAAAMPTPPEPLILHVIPIAFNQQTHEFSILFTEQNRGPFTEFRSVISFDDFTRVRSQDIMTELGKLTYSMYNPEHFMAQTPFFDKQGALLNAAAKEGYVFVEVPYIGGYDLFRRAGEMNPADKRNFNWLAQSIITNAATPPTINRSFPIEKELFDTLKNTLPRLQRNTAGDLTLRPNR